MTTILQQISQQQTKMLSYQGSRGQTRKVAQKRHSPTKSISDPTLPRCVASLPSLPALPTSIELELPDISTSESENEM